METPIYERAWRWVFKALILLWGALLWIGFAAIIVLSVRGLYRAGLDAVPSLLEFIAIFCFIVAGVALLIAFARWTKGKFSEKALEDVKGRIGAAVVFGGIFVAIIMLWQTPDILHVPLAKLTLGDLLVNLSKLCLLIVVGAAFLRCLFGEWY
jgi:hypothetical protein